MWCALEKIIKYCKKTFNLHLCQDSTTLKLSSDYIIKIHKNIATQQHCSNTEFKDCIINSIANKLVSRWNSSRIWHRLKHVSH